MIILVVFGGLMLIMSVFYLLNSIQRYGTWTWATFMTVLSVVILGIGIWGMLPKWTGKDQTAAAQASSETKARLSSSQSSTKTSSSSTASITTGLGEPTEAQTKVKNEKKVLTQLQKNFKTFGTVSYSKSNKTYSITPTDTKTVESMNYILSNPSQAEDTGWSNLTGSVVKISAQLKNMLGKGYSLTLTQPNNTSAMFTVKDGVTMYDISK